MNTKVPSLKDQGKEYDGFTITITGDKYGGALSAAGGRWWREAACAGPAGGAVLCQEQDQGPAIATASVCVCVCVTLHFQCHTSR